MVKQDGRPHSSELQSILRCYHLLSSDPPPLRQDRWLAAGKMCDRFPLLYTHAANTEVSVRRVCDNGIELFLVPRLTRVAAAELAEVDSLLSQLCLHDVAFGPCLGHPHGRDWGGAM